MLETIRLIKLQLEFSMMCSRILRIKPVGMSSIPTPKPPYLWWLKKTAKEMSIANPDIPEIVYAASGMSMDILGG